MLDMVTAGTFHAGYDAETIVWSPKLYDSLGFAGDDAARLTSIEALAAPDDLELLRETLRQHSRKEDCYLTSLRLEDSAGAIRYFNVHGCWMSIEADDGVHIGFLTETTELVVSEQKAQRAETLFRAFFDNAPAAVFIKNRRLRHVYGNQMAADYAGCSLEDFLAKAAPELVDAETAARLTEVDHAVLDRGETVTSHGDVVTRSGERRHLLDTKFPIVDPGTGERMLGGFGIDISRQREAEHALAVSQRREALSQLVTGIAHDFNNSLAVMQANLDFLSETRNRLEQKECGEALQQAIEHSRLLTQQLLAYGRQAVLKDEVVDLNALLADIAQLLKRTLPETISLQCRLEKGLANTKADRAEIDNAILNLAMNAIDAMPRGGTLVLQTFSESTEAGANDQTEEAGARGGRVCVSVEDTGFGMTPEIEERAFDPFFTTKEPDKGTGMGLATVAGLVEQLGGDVKLTSEVGSGTRVIIRLPASDEEVSETVENSAGTSGGDERILVVEDEEALRSILVKQLGYLGYRVSEAPSGAAAVSMLEDGQAFDLIITDVVMPGVVQGPELAREARRLRPEIPVLFMSGYPREIVETRANLQWQDNYLMKPIRLAALAEAVRHALTDARPAG